MAIIDMSNAPDPITKTFAAMLQHTGGLNPVVFGRVHPKALLNSIVSSEISGIAASEYVNGFMQIDYGSLRLMWTVLTDGEISGTPFLVSGFDSDRGAATSMRIFIDSLRAYAARSHLKFSNISKGEADTDLCEFLRSARMPNQQEFA